MNGRVGLLFGAVIAVALVGVGPGDVANLSRVPILAIEVPGGTHAGAFDTTLPQIFQFFEKHAQ